jgi:hypothetical protein
MGIILGAITGVLVVHALAMPGTGLEPTVVEAGRVTTSCRTAAGAPVACTPTPTATLNPDRVSSTPTHTPNPTLSPTATATSNVLLVRPPNLPIGAPTQGGISANVPNLQFLQTVNICNSIDADSTRTLDQFIRVRDIRQPDFNTPQIAGYLKFNLGVVPAGSTVASATLRVYLDQGDFDGPITLPVWRVTADWTPQSVGITTPAYAYPPANKTITSAPGFKSWNVTTMVKGWMSGAAPNDGFRIFTDETGDYDIRFHSDQNIGRGGIDQSPCLDVTYAAPTGSITPTAAPTWTVVPTWTPVPQPTVDLSGIGPQWGDFSVLDVDALQTIFQYSFLGNDDPHAVPLVAGKTTLVRVYVALKESPVSRQVQVSLQAFRNGQNLGPCAGVNPANATIDPNSQLNTEIIANRREPFIQDNINATFSFTVPASCSWLGQGPVTIRARVRAPNGGGFIEDNHSENDNFDRSLIFYKMRPLRVQPYIFTYMHAGSPNFGKAPTAAQVAGIFTYIKNLYPIDSVDIRPPQYWQTTRNMDFDNGSDEFRSAFDDFLDGFEDCCGDDDSVDSNLAILDDSLFCCSGIQGVSWIDTRIAICHPGFTPDCAHEIGHNLGLKHAGNDHGENGSHNDQKWVFLNPHGEIGGLGWNAGAPNKLIPSEEDLPGQFHSHDFMSYGACNNFANPAKYNDASVPYYCATWVSPENYGRMAQRLNCSDPQTFDEDDNQDCLGGIGPFNVLIGEEPPLLAFTTTDDYQLVPIGSRAGPAGLAQTGAIEAAIPQQPAAPREFLLVNGTLFPDGHAELKPFYRRPVNAGGSGREGSGPYRIELQDADGRVLGARNFDTHESSLHGAEPFPELIDETLPWVDGTTRIVLLHDGALLAERVVTPNVPQVTLLAPNGGETLPGTGELTISWTGADADGDPLTYWVEYSADGGATWRTVQRNVQTTSVAVDLTNLGGSNRGLVRVLATDGVNTTIDASDATFTVGAKAPWVAIETPEDAAQVASGDDVLLVGLAIDPQDGQLPGEAFTWVSDRDGPLGSGATLFASNLSPGDHVITLVANNRAGLQGSASIHLTVK